MKTRILKPVLSLSAIAFAAFAAFAFSTAPQKEELIDIWGHNPQDECVETNVLCSENANNPVCTLGIGGQQLFELQGTSCSKVLYRK